MSQSQTASGTSAVEGFALAEYLSARQAYVERALERAVVPVRPEKLYESMRYSLLSGGKRLRPILCLASCELAGGTAEIALPTACALEMLHTASLVHDDLPAMDDDDYRRGKMTNHRVYGEAIAVLTGDALWSYSLEFILLHTRDVPAEHLTRVLQTLLHCVGAAGLVGGQVVDLESEGTDNVDLETLEFIHSRKTASLIEAAVVTGAILADARDDTLRRLSRYAQNIGLAFQILDDLLDLTGTREELGKTPGKDQRVAKVTYPRLLGMAESRRHAEQLIGDAKRELAPFGPAALPLIAIADYVIQRSH